MSDPRVLAEAEFTRDVCKYWLLHGSILMVVCVVTIPLLPIWLVLGMMITGRYLDHMSCTLTEKSLIVKKGMLNRIEKTIPLEKITDLGLNQGPIMRAMDLHALSLETAGSSGTPYGGALVSLLGITDTVGFRDKVLAQRDLLVDSSPTPSAQQAPPGDAGVLEDIRDTLHRIEDVLKQPGR